MIKNNNNILLYLSYSCIFLFTVIVLYYLMNDTRESFNNITKKESKSLSPSERKKYRKERNIAHKKLRNEITRILKDTNNNLNELLTIASDLPLLENNLPNNRTPTIETDLPLLENNLPNNRTPTIETDLPLLENNLPNNRTPTIETDLPLLENNLPNNRTPTMRRGLTERPTWDMGPNNMPSLENTQNNKNITEEFVSVNGHSFKKLDPIYEQVAIVENTTNYIKHLIDIKNNDSNCTFILDNDIYCPSNSIVIKHPKNFKVKEYL